MSSSAVVVAERPCSLLVHNNSSEVPNVQQLRKQLEEGNVDTKIEALKKVITLLLNGESLPQLLMPIIRFVLPSKDRTIKKLLLLYWEVVDKKSADGKTLHEMILVWCVEKISVKSVDSSATPRG
jgi:coatomer subunit beta